jgi:hypothetical protein
MAKRVAKRQTNTERAKREDERRLVDWAAFEVALLIEFEAKAFRAGLCIGSGDERQGRRLESGSTETEFYDGERVIWKDFYSSGERAYTVIGRLLCQYSDHKNPSKFLRQVANKIEGKEPHSPGDDWYDDAIMKAYEKAWSRCRSFRPIVRWPSFSEFRDIFREQNPKLQGASDRSLRRSLRRLGHIIRQDRRGRPKEK